MKSWASVRLVKNFAAPFAPFARIVGATRGATVWLDEVLRRRLRAAAVRGRLGGV